MKNLVFASLLIMSTNVFASKMVNIKTMTNKVLDQATNDLIGTEHVTHSAAKKVIELKGSGKDAAEIREKTVAQALHSTCPFFDDGVNISREEKGAIGSASAASTFFDNNPDENDAEYKLTLRAISKVNGLEGVEVYSGQTSGNNTVGTVLGFYDTKNNEISVFASTNCGRDD